jgi:hypothetical protein
VRSGADGERQRARNRRAGHRRLSDLVRQNDRREPPFSIGHHAVSSCRDESGGVGTSALPTVAERRPQCRR